MVASCVKAVITVIKKVKTKAVRLVNVKIVIADKDLMYNGTLFRCVECTTERCSVALNVQRNDVPLR